MVLMRGTVVVKFQEALVAAYYDCRQIELGHVYNTNPY